MWVCGRSWILYLARTNVLEVGKRHSVYRVGPYVRRRRESAARGMGSTASPGVPVRFNLGTPCRAFGRRSALRMTEAYIQVKPFGTSFHYQRRCANGHCTDNVKHAEVELHFGITRISVGAKNGRPRHSHAFSQGLVQRSRARPVYLCYCGRRAGEIDLDGSVVVVGADHIIPKAMIDPESIRRDRELLLFAKEIQLVTACRSDNAAKQTALMDIDSAREIFVRHVLKNQTRGPNLGLVSIFERLYRIVALNLRVKAHPSNAAPTKEQGEAR